jgi:ubiquinone/menaquinone biosynthesis C-methylase UbiE
MKVDDAYKIIAKTYDTHRDTSPYFKIIEGVTRRCFAENTAGRNFKRGLDLGCGTGRNLPLFAGKCRRVAGMDYTPEMLAHAKAAHAANAAISLLLGDARHLPFADESFDLIGSFKALPHVPNIETALGEIHRVAQKGALVFTEFYSPYSFRRLLTRMKHHTDWHTVEQSTQLLRAAGFTVKAVYGLRTFILTEYLCFLPGAYALFNYLENRFTHSWVNRFSGYYVVVSEK